MVPCCRGRQAIYCHRLCFVATLAQLALEGHLPAAQAYAEFQPVDPNRDRTAGSSTRRCFRCLHQFRRLHRIRCRGLRCRVALAASFLRRMGRRLRQRVPIWLGGICLFCRLILPRDEVALHKWTRSRMERIFSWGTANARRFGGVSHIPGI